MIVRLARICIALGMIICFVGSSLFAVLHHVLEPEEAMAAVTAIDATANNGAGGRHFGGSPSTVFTSDSTGYSFYVDSDGTCRYQKTTNTTNTSGDWAAAGAVVNSSTSCLGVVVWYDQWTPGDTTGTIIHVVTWDLADIYYSSLDTSSDTLSTALNISGANQSGTLAAGANIASITKSSTGYVYAGIVDAADAFVLRCNTSCTANISNWTETLNNAGTPAQPFTLGDDYLILVPKLSGNVMALWWDVSANLLYSNIYTTSWSSSWTQVVLNVEENTTYDAAYAAVVNKDTGDVYVAIMDDANTIAGMNDDVRTFVHTSSWTEKTAAYSNDMRGLVTIALGLDMNTSSIYLATVVRENEVVADSMNIYIKRSTDGMTTWSNEYGRVNAEDDNIFGLHFNYGSTTRLYLTWVADNVDSVFGQTVADLTSGAQLYAGTYGLATTAIAPSTNDAHIATFTLQSSSETATVTSILLNEEGMINANTMLSNIDLLYETGPTCTYDGNEAPFGTSASFSASDQATITGSMSVGTTIVCVYARADTSASAYGTVKLEISLSASDISVSSATAIDVAAVPQNGLSAVRNTKYGAVVTADATPYNPRTSHSGKQPTMVYVTDVRGYLFYRDADGSVKYVKTTDGGATWGTPQAFHSSTALIGVSVWYDGWTSGDSGAVIHVVTWDTADVFYTTLTTGESSDTVSANLNASGANQGGSFSVGNNWATITKATNAYVYIGIIDNGDTFVIRCNTSCTASDTNWTETTITGGTTPFVTPAISDTDSLQLFPQSGGGLLAVYNDVSADDYLYNTFNGTVWASSTWSTIFNDAQESGTLDMSHSLTYDPSTFTVYLAMIDYNASSILGGGDDTLRMYRWSSGSWAARTEAITNESRGTLLSVSLAYDSLNSTVYVYYAIMTDQTKLHQAIFEKSSTDGMGTWSSETGVLEGSNPSSKFGIRTNFISAYRLALQAYEEYTNSLYTVTTYNIPAIVSLQVTDGSIAFGTRALNTTINTTAGQLNDIQTITVDQGPADLDIRSTTFSDGTNTWALGASNGAAQVQWEYSLNGSSWSTMAVANQLYALDTNVADDATRSLYLQLTMPTSSVSLNPYSTTVTVVASEP